MAESMICEMSGPQHLRNVFAILEPMKRPRVPTEAQFDLQTINIRKYEIGKLGLTGKSPKMHYVCFLR